MKNTKNKQYAEMRTEYDFASMKGGVRGKYSKTGPGDKVLVMLDDDIAEAFPTAAAVNETLRAVLEVAERVGRPKPRRKAAPPTRIAQGPKHQNPGK